MLLDVADELKTTPTELHAARRSAMVGEVKELHQQRLDAMKDKLFSGEIDRCLFAAQEVGGLKVLTVIQQRHRRRPTCARWATRSVTVSRTP